MNITPLSLASARVTEREFCRRVLLLRLRVLVAFLAFDVLAMAAGFFGMGSVNERRDLLAQRLKRTNAQTQIYRQELGDLRTRQDLARWHHRLSARGLDVIDSLQVLATALPANSWLNRVTAGVKDGTVQVDGGAADLTAVARLATALGSGKTFQDVRLGPSDTLQVDNFQAIRFTLFLKLSGFANSSVSQSDSGKGGST